MAKILIVDDDSNFRETVQAILADEGHEAAIAENGEVAVQTFNNVEPDLIILDMLMPKLGGFDCATALRATPLGQDIPIIFLSGAYKNSKIINEAEEKFNAAAYLLKPFDASVLLDAIADSLGESAIEEVEEKVATPLPDNGSLLQHSVLSLLLRIDAEKHTGILDLFADKQRARLFFRRGRIVQAQINDPELNLGMALIRMGHLSPFDYKALLEHVADQAVGLHQAIKDFKSVKGTVIKEAYKQLIPQIAGKTLALNGQFRWFAGGAFAKLMPLASVHIMPTIFSALPQIPPLQLEPHLEQHKRMRLNKGTHWGQAKQWLTHGLKQDSVLQSVNGRARVGQIYGAVDDEQKRQSRMIQLFLLIAGDAVKMSEEISELEPSMVIEVPEQNIIGAQQQPDVDDARFSQIPGADPAKAGSASMDLAADDAADQAADAGQSFSPEDEAARQKISAKFKEIAKLDFYGVLNVTREKFDAAQVKKNYFALARDFHSDSYSGRNLGSAARKLEAVFSKISEAYNTLSDENKRGEYDAQLDIMAQGGTADIGAILQAEGLLDKARLVMERGDLNSAFRFLEQAVALYKSPDIVAWHAYCGWRARGNQPAEAEEISRIIIEQTKEARIPRAYEFCAVIARYSGQFDLAKKMLRKARNEDGDSPALQREGRLVAKAEEDAAKKGGLAGKLFGR